LWRDNVGMAESSKKAPHPAHDEAYPDHDSFPGLPKHFSVISGQSAGGDHNQAVHDSVGAELKAQGFEPQSIHGHSESHEHLWMVPHSGSKEHIEKIQETAWKFNQNHLIHHADGKSSLVGRDGEKASGEGFVHGPHLRNHFLQVPSGHKVQLNLGDIKKSESFDIATKRKKKRADAAHPWHYGVIGGLNIFHATHEAHDQLPGTHVKSPDDKQLEDAVSEAQDKKDPALIIHGNPPPLLRENGPPGDFPHAYDWHCCEGGGDMGKAEFKPEPDTLSNQYAGLNISTYRPVAHDYGQIFPDRPSNLQFYRGIEDLESKIDDLTRKAGFQSYFVGGDLGQPDIANKNYAQGYLALVDPVAQTDDHDPYTRVWRKLHELAHGMTLNEVDSVHGKGKRVGKLGELSPREAKRALYWEWLAGHKQRELAEEAGHKISDEDFNREMNTLMHDSLHRVITGTYPQPSDEGFQPFSELVPIEQAIKQVDDHAKNAGLAHDEATFESTGVPKDVMRNYEAIKKSEGLSGELKEGGKIKKFYLWREQDESGVSGTGRVAEGVVFSNGWVAMNWLTSWGSVGFYPSIHQLLSIHGHGDKTKIVYEHEEDGPKVIHEPGEPVKEAIDELKQKKKDHQDVRKAFYQHDGETLTDPKSHDAASQAVPEWLMKWGVDNLVPMAKEAHAEFDLAGKKIKVRKVMEDLYSGWIEHASHIIHQFEKLTMPLVLSQLQSKLELYGKEENPVPEVPEVKPGDVVESPAEQAKEEQTLESIASKIKQIQEQVGQFYRDEVKEHQESITGKELTSGIENPEKDCPACERPANQCVCYLNLPTPRIEVTARGVNIFFKSEWQEEDISNFKQDLIRRAGTVLEQRRILKAKEALQKIKAAK
jgi:hypothetical protein